MDAIEVNELRKSYGDVQALDGVSFAVREGEVFGLLGPNGAGKSTTVRVLVTLTAPDGGTASVGGHDVVREPNAVRRTIGYVPQESGVDRFGDRPREPRAAGAHPGDGRPRPAAARRRAARARRDRRRRRPRRPRLLGRHEAAPRRRDGAGAPAARPVPRRADDRPRSRGARRDVGRGRTARRAGVAHDPADDPLPRGGRRAGRPPRDRLARPGRRAGHDRPS